MIVIGLDGASFNYLDPILNSGALPSFMRLMDRGVRSECLSTIPPLTPPAWSTMFTGVNPGKHGIFDFLQPDQSGTFRMVDATFRRRKSFLGHAEANDIRTISILVPYTFPPDPDASGLIVSGLGTPSAESDFIRPHGYRDSLLRDFPFLKDVDPTKGQSIETLHRHLADRTRLTVDLTRWAMSRFPDWGICFVVFQATDLIPHFYSRYFDPTHPLHADAPAEFRDSLAAVYRAIDPFLGQCMDIVEKDGGWVVLVSDHGSQPLASAIGKDAFLARWLEDEGYLVTGGSRGRARQLAKAHVGSVANRLLYLAKRYTPHGLRNAVNRVLGRRKEAMVGGLTAVPFMEDIIWDKTRAFCAPGGYGVGMYINREGDFPSGIVPRGAEYFELRDRIRAGLKKLEIAPGVPLFNEVFARDDVLWGPAVSLAPDLLLLWREDRRLVENNYTLVDGRRLDPPEARPGDRLTWCGTHRQPRARNAGCAPGGRLTWCGTHRIEGLFGIAGQGAKAGISLERPVGLADTMPTILFLAGLPIPSDVDGRVILEAFEEGFVASNSPKVGPPEGLEPPLEEGGMTSSDSEKLLDLLEGLGYLH
jgi:predicted AlkP superfamily phosphohydrolase/phosphomutase